MSEHFIDALMALSALLVSAAALIGALRQLKLASIKQLAARGSPPRAADIESLREGLRHLDTEHDKTREAVAHLRGRMNGHTKG